MVCSLTFAHANFYLFKFNLKSFPSPDFRRYSDKEIEQNFAFCRSFSFSFSVTRTLIPSVLFLIFHHFLSQFVTAMTVVTTFLLYRNIAVICVTAVTFYEFYQPFCSPYFKKIIRLSCQGASKIIPSIGRARKSLKIKVLIKIF